jgi:hypothetical protein
MDLMKLFVTISLIAIGIVNFSFGLAQSKKELKLQLEEMSKKNANEKAISDSIILSKDRHISNLQKQVNSLKDSIQDKNKKLEQKIQELESYMNATSRMGGRIRMKEPDLSKFRFASPATIVLKLLVDENGMVVEAVNDSKRSTTTDKAILEEVIELVKKDLRYSRESGASLLQSNYTVKIEPKN